MEVLLASAILNEVGQDFVWGQFSYWSAWGLPALTPTEARIMIPIPQVNSLAHSYHPHVQNRLADFKTCLTLSISLLLAGEDIARFR